MQIEELIETLWRDYQRLAPIADRVQRLLAPYGTLIHDHIAFRGMDRGGLGIESLARPFLESGYRAAGTYEFPAKKLRAQHFEPPRAGLPKVFVSELRVDALSHSTQTHIDGLLDQIPPESASRGDFCVSGRLWSVDFATYESLCAESEYAGWLSAFGFRANHFTLDVDGLHDLESLEAVNALLLSEGIALNESGGLIKGNPESLLEQSSTLAAEIEHPFRDGVHRVPSCYYEFARRYRDESGARFEGFIAKSADRIFESTDRRR